MRVNAINLQNISFTAKQKKFNPLEYNQRMRETERIVDKGLATLYTEFEGTSKSPFDKAIYYTSVSFSVPKSKNIATLSIEPYDDIQEMEQGRLMLEVEDEKNEITKSIPITIGPKDLIISYLNDSINSNPQIARTIMQTSDNITLTE